MLSQYTKFEVFRFTGYEAMNGCAKCRKWGGLGALKVMGNVTLRQSAYEFLFDFNRNHASILYRFRDTAGYLSKVADLDPPHLHLALPQGVTPVEFRGDLWLQKTMSPWAIVRCCLCDPTFSRFSRTPTCDGQTQGHGYYRGCIASRGNNSVWLYSPDCLRDETSHHTGLACRRSPSTNSS